LQTTAPISGGKRALKTKLPSMSKKYETLRNSCWRCASAAASRRCVQWYFRTSFSTCAAVPLSAICTSTDSFAGVAKRYALFNIDAHGRPILRKASAHGLGHLIDPYDDAHAPPSLPKPRAPLRDNVLIGCSPIAQRL